MKLIIINIFSNSYLYPFIFSIFWYIRQKIQILKLNDKFTDEIYYSFIIYFSEIIAVFGHFIIICRIKNDNKKEEKKDNNIIVTNETEYIVKPIDFIEKNKKIKIFFLLLLCSFFDILVALILSYNVNNDQDSNFEVYCRPFQIIINSILSIIFLKLIIHRHQILSIILIVLSGFCIFIIEESRPTNFLYILLQRFLAFIISGLLDIIETIILNLISPYLLLFFKGIIGIIGVLIYSLIKSHLNLLIKNIISSFDIYLILFILSSMLFNLFFELTLQFLTPTHICIGDCFSSIIFYIFDDLKKGNNILKIVGYLFLSFGCLVFNEIIILNFCNLGKNTKYEISKRGEQSLESLCKEDDNNS